MATNRDESRDDLLVLALDVGSTATRGAVYDASGEPVGKRHKVEHAFTAKADGTNEIDPDVVAGDVEQILDGLAGDAGAPIAGVALDTFASSLVGVGADGKPTTPCFTYADARCAAQVDALRAELDEAAAQQRTGCRFHTSYQAPRLRWLAETQPDTFRATRRWMSLGEYVHHRLLGVAAPGTSTAAWTGLLDRRTGEWDGELLGAAGVSPDQLGTPRDPGEPYSDVDAAVGRRWRRLRDAAWFAAVGDGLASNFGAGAVDGAVVALSAATSGAMRLLISSTPDRLPTGVWCYRVDARRSLLGGALNDVGRVVTWLRETVRLGDDPDTALDDACTAHPDPGAPLVLPFLTGERSIGWAGRARAVAADLSAATTGPQLARGALEGTALCYRRLARQLAEVTGGPHRIHASGGVIQYLPGFTALLANALQLPVVPVTMKRVTLRGTALLALEHLAPDVARGEPVLGDGCEPNPGQADYYAERLARFDRLYDAVIAPASA